MSNEKQREPEMGTCDVKIGYIPGHVPHVESFDCKNWKPIVEPVPPQTIGENDPPPDPKGNWMVAPAAPSPVLTQPSAEHDLKVEWMAQDKILDYTNWLQSELLKAREAVHYAIEAALRESASPMSGTEMLNSVLGTLQSRVEGINTGGDKNIMETVDRIVERESAREAPSKTKCESNSMTTPPFPELWKLLDRAKVRYSRDHGMPNPSEPFPTHVEFDLATWKAVCDLREVSPEAPAALNPQICLKCGGSNCICAGIIMPMKAAPAAPKEK
jgi:hypothetical protein